MQLPGKKHDDSARKMRQQFLDGLIDIEEFLKENAFHLPKTKAARFQNQVNTYAAASIVIENFWKYLEQKPVKEALIGLRRKKYPSASYDELVEGFFLYCAAIVGVYQKHYLDEAKQRNTDGARGDADIAFLRFAGVARKRYPNLKGLPFPSMKDLIAMVERMAHVIPRVFERDLGYLPSLEETLRLLRQPSILHFFIQLMVNDRNSTYPLFAKLEGKKRGNLNDGTRRFDPGFFEMHQCDGSISLRLKPSVIEEYRSHYVRAAKRRAKRHKADTPMLGCPALYTGLIKEMYDWTCNQLEHWARALE